MTWTIFSFSLFLLMFMAIGVFSVIKARKTSHDYLLASHSVKPWLVALSAVATNNSGYMFIGMIGLTYATGISSMWVILGWIVGDFISSFVVHKRLRIATEKEHVLTFAGVVSRWGGVNYKIVRLVGGIITVIFLGTYAAAQLSAGSKALHVIFGWNYHIGAFIGAGIVLVYCFSGGIRASIWTDAAQSFVMIIAMAVLLVMSIHALGGFHAFTEKLSSVSPTFMDPFALNKSIGVFWGPFLFIMGWLFAGFGVIGQPHIMVRFMVMDKPKNMGRVRAYYYSWYLLFSAATIAVGLAARLLIPQTGNFDAELALPTIVQHFLSPFFVGLVLAGLFAATMSTADSQILSCSASITRDLTFGKRQSYLITKLSTVFVTIIALMISVKGSESVFSLVVVAWSALASSFGPLLTVWSLGGRPSQRTALSMMLFGIGAMLLWRFVHLNVFVYEVAPGLIAGFIPYVVAIIFNKCRPTSPITPPKVTQSS